MTNLDLLHDTFDPEEIYVKADGFDDAVIGYVVEPLRLVYSVSKCIEILMSRDGMERTEAIEFFEFNVSGSYMGKETPIWCEDMILKNEVGAEELAAKMSCNKYHVGQTVRLNQIGQVQTIFPSDILVIITKILEEEDEFDLIVEGFSSHYNSRVEQYIRFKCIN